MGPFDGQCRKEPETWTKTPTRMPRQAHTVSKGPSTWCAGTAGFEPSTTTGGSTCPRPYPTTEIGHAIRTAYVRGDVLTLVFTSGWRMVCVPSAGTVVILDESGERPMLSARTMCGLERHHEGTDPVLDALAKGLPGDMYTLYGLLDA